MLRTDIALTQFTAHLYNSASEPPSARHWASYPIPTGRRDACTLWVRQPFEDSGIIGYAQNLISVELNNMVKQRQAQRALCGQVLEDVIHGALETSEAQRRLAGVGVNSTRRNVVLLAVSAAHHKALVSTSVPQALENAVAAVVGQDLVVVVHDDGGAAPALARELSSHLAEAGIHATIGIGGAYTKPNGLRWSYFEARDAASHGLPVNEPERLSLTSLLLASEDVPLADMANESLSPLRTFDAAHGSELMTTLESYLNHNGSVAAVAEALTLHRNTVRYRLAQITELTGYDPSRHRGQGAALARPGGGPARRTAGLKQRGVTKRPINGPGGALSDPALQGLAGLLPRLPVLGLGLGRELDLPGVQREEGRRHRSGRSGPRPSPASKSRATTLSWKSPRIFCCRCAALAAFAARLPWTGTTDSAT